MLNGLAVLTTEQDRLSFMQGIVALAKVEGVDPSELVFFQKAMESLALSESASRYLVHLLTSDEDVPLDLTFQSKRQGLFLLKEAIQLCFMDGHYSDAEKSLILEIARRLDIRPDSARAIENWVMEGVSWSNRGDALLELEV